MSDVGGAFGGADGLTKEGVEKRLVISDYHGTLDAGGIDALQALVKMYLAGHDVVIASGGTHDAQERILASDDLRKVFENLRLSSEAQKHVKDGVLSVLDKSDLIKGLKARGVSKEKIRQPDVWFEDDHTAMVTIKPKVAVDPGTEQFVAFIALAKNDPNGALDMLLEGEASVQELFASADIQQKRQDTFEALCDFQDQFPQEFDSVARYLDRLSDLPISQDVIDFLSKSVLSDGNGLTDLFYDVLEHSYQGPGLPLKNPFSLQHATAHFDW